MEQAKNLTGVQRLSLPVISNSFTSIVCSGDLRTRNKHKGSGNFALEIQEPTLAQGNKPTFTGADR